MTRGAQSRSGKVLTTEAFCRHGICHPRIRASPRAQLVKNLPAMQETPVQFLGQEDPLEKG